MSKYITPIQLRVARNVLNLGVRDTADILKVSKATISKAELGKTRDFFYKHSPALINFFEQKGIIFPSEYSIRYISNNLEKIDQTENLLNRFQLISSRHVMNISQKELAKAIGIDKGIISRAEQLLNEEFIKPQDDSIILKLRYFFQQHNIDYVDQLSIFFKKYIDKELNY